MNLLSKVDFSSYRTITLAVSSCWVLFAIVSVLLSLYLTAVSFPGIYESQLSVVVSHALIVSVSAVPVFIIALALMQQIELNRRQLKAMVRTDDLTGLLSREAFLEDFRGEIDLASDKISDAFLIVDADFFKKINDTHGHIAGDQALLAITNALQKGIRETDRIGRLGGEEFAIHLRGVNKELATGIAERLRQNVMAASNEAGIPDLSLSVSIGAVFYNTKQDPVSLLIGADRQLYRAKGNGRNRVEFEFRETLSSIA